MPVGTGSDESVRATTEADGAVEQAASAADHRSAWLEHLLLGGFGTALAVGLARHPMWFDETQAWNIARASSSLRDVVANTRYEGHPPLWHLLLFGLTQVSTDVRSMQVLTWAVAVASAALILKRAPWSLLVRAMVCLGYYFAFEYTVISRSYCLTVLFLLVSLVVKPRSWAWAASLALVALSSALGIVLAGSVCLASVVAELPRRPSRQSIARICAVAAVSLASLISILKPADSTVGSGFSVLGPGLLRRVESALSGIASGVLPVPDRDMLWQGLFLKHFSLETRAAIGLAILVSIAFVLWPWRQAFLLWTIGAISLLCFFVVVYPDLYLRHSGHYFLVALAAAWLAAETGSRPTRWRWDGARVAFAGVLVIHAMVGIAYYSEYTVSRPFADSKAIADAIRSDAKDPMLVSLNDRRATNIAAYLGTPVWSLGEGREVRYIRYDRDDVAATSLPLSQLAARAKALLRQAHGPVILISGATDADDRALARAVPGGVRIAAGVYLSAAGS